MSLDPMVRDPLVDRAIRLFQFLMRAQEVRDEPARTVEAYRREGSVLWFGDLPHHPAVRSALDEGEPEPGAPFLTVDRVPRLAPPAPDHRLGEWLDGPRDDPDTEPRLHTSITRSTDEVGDDGLPIGHVEYQDERPETVASFGEWLRDWQAWADQERRDRPIRELYGELFAMYVNALGHAEELELVVGIGCLAWTPADHPTVLRHLLTAPVAIEFDDNTGRLTVVSAESVEAAAVEVEMLDARLITQPQQLNESRTRARDFEGNMLHRAEAGAIVRRIVHALSPDADYQDTDIRPTAVEHPVAAFAPALILRKRARKGFVEIFRTIVDQLSSGQPVPAGVLPLVDPEHLPAVDCEPGDGAVVLVDDDPFLPMPVNDRQLQILRRVDTHAQTLVQGPPGTGKTHTAAALISHLLAQGKRVLVTAHTDRALREVRAKLPAAIRPLAVSVVGSTREDMSDLRTAVERIAATAADHEPAEGLARMDRALRSIEDLRGRRAAAYGDLLAAREDEVQTHEFTGYRGTLTSIAREFATDVDRYGWLSDHVDDVLGAAPLQSPEIVEWHALVTDPVLGADEIETRRRPFEPAGLPDPRRFADMTAAEAAAAAADGRLQHQRVHPAAAAVHRLPVDVRDALRARLHTLVGELDQLSNRREHWMAAALDDARSRRADLWGARHDQITQLIGRATPLVQNLGSVTEVELRSTEVTGLVPLARNLHEYLAGGRTIKVGPDRRPKIGALASKQVKQAAPLFEAVLVDGLPPTTSAQLAAFLTWVDATKTLSALDRAWPTNVVIPPEDTLHERLHWHATEVAQLGRVLALAAELGREEQRLAQLGLPIPDWTDSVAIRAHAGLVEAAAAADALAVARRPLDDLQRRLADEARWAEAVPAVLSMLEAVRGRDHERYALDYRRLERLVEVRRLVARRDQLGARLHAGAPRLHAALMAEPAQPEWPDRLARFSQAWAWAAAGTLIRNRKALDVNEVQAELTRLEVEIRSHVEELAATRAWNHAVAADRLTRTARASLEQYAYLVRRLGKGTGKYQAQRKAEIRQAMDRCRSAVPVWILPTYRIADQLRIQPDMFDVVVVDEASQAGLEATFLQYLAPRIVVIGDDKQVSPSAVGVDQQHLRDLANQYLYEDPFRSSWQDPQRSLFDEAKMRFTGMLTLVEHRRCVPEIIEFSNRIAYEPDGVRLVPVRQFGADRLDPIKPVLLESGYQRGTTNKTNPVEADAIVEQIEKCCVDPRYDGLTFGVVSLLGTAQAKLIEKQLLGRLSAEEWAARDLRCGDAADFQGSERDVMFLSMVAAPEAGRRQAALTRDLYVQRYNVAASRAKDQMWLFHSIRPDDLGNSEDMRFRLLEYCYGVERSSKHDDEAVTEPLPEHVRVEPFESLFEQRVCHRLVERGLTVVPQVDAQDYHLDLVVVGAMARLAIECDGDTWHGPKAYRREITEQRELERCGWNIVRVRESEFTIDPARALKPVWDALARLEIHPLNRSPGPHAPSDDDRIDDPAHGPEASAETSGEPADGAADDLDREDGLVEDDVAEDDFAEDHAVKVVDPDPVEQAGEAGASPAPVVRGPLDQPLPPYRPFRGTVVPVDVAQRADLIDGLVAIVAMEGPILGHRLHSVYVRSSEGMRVGQQIAKVLNSAVTAAVRQGRIVQDDPLLESGVRPRTFRLPDQPPVVVRELGPRLFEHVPPAELAAVMHSAGELVGWDDSELVLRATLGRYGVRRMGSNIRAQLTAAVPLAQRLRTDRGW
jgi:very-short-patch-repair endonuclease